MQDAGAATGSVDGAVAVAIIVRTINGRKESIVHLICAKMIECVAAADGGGGA